MWEVRRERQRERWVQGDRQRICSQAKPPSGPNCTDLGDAFQTARHSGDCDAPWLAERKKKFSKTRDHKIPRFTNSSHKTCLNVIRSVRSRYPVVTLRRSSLPSLPSHRTGLDWTSPLSSPPSFPREACFLLWCWQGGACTGVKHSRADIFPPPCRQFSYELRGERGSLSLGRSTSSFSSSSPSWGPLLKIVFFCNTPETWT